MRLSYQSLANGSGRWACIINGGIPTIQNGKNAEQIRRQLSARLNVARAQASNVRGSAENSQPDLLTLAGHWLGGQIGVCLPHITKQVAFEVTDEISGLAMELLPVGGTPVGLVGPVQRSLCSHVPQPVQMGGIRRLLIVVSDNPEPFLPFLDREVETVQRLNKLDNVFVDIWRGGKHDIAGLVDKIALADIVHVCGHVHEVTDQQGRFQHRLQLDGSACVDISISDLVPADRSPPRLVWLNTCHAGLPVPGGGVASLLKAGCCSVIGSLLPIEDESAEKFVSVFYEHLVAGGDVARCVFELRKCLASVGHPSWSSIGSYGEGDRLF